MVKKITRLNDVNDRISQKFPTPAQTQTRVIIADFGFVEAYVEDGSYLDDMSKDIADKVSQFVTHAEEELKKFDNYPPDKPSDAIQKMMRQHQQVTTAAWHGTSCHMVIQDKKGWFSEFDNCTNLAPHVAVSLILLDPLWSDEQGDGPGDAPIMLASQVFPTIERDENGHPERNIEAYKQARRITPNWWPGSIVEGLDRIIDCCRNGQVNKGDVVVLPFEIEAEGGVVPITTHKEIEVRIHFLTNVCEVIVVVSAGNDFLDQPFPKAEQDTSTTIFHSGTTCGAVVVAEELLHPDATSRRAYRWIDAFLDVPAPDWTSSSGIEQDYDKRILQRSFQLYDGRPKTSASTAAVAALIATVQEARKRRSQKNEADGLKVLPNLRPYEARAHLRQWRGPEPTRRDQADGGGSGGHKTQTPPDALSWLVGTQVWRVGPDHPLYGDDVDILPEDLDVHS